MSNILFILHLPPPVHGPSMVGGYIKDSNEINAAFRCRYINLGISRTVDEVGRKPLRKIGRYLSLLSRVFGQLIAFRPELCYISLSVGDSGFYKDVPVVLLTRLFGVKRLYHLHNKGVKLRSEKCYNDWLYRLVFHNAEVILLSEYLYGDIEKYVPTERLHYCANGIEDVDTSQFIGNRDEIQQLSAVNLLFLSNLIVSKGVFVLLDACKQLLEKDIAFHCTLVGGEGDIDTKLLNCKIEELGLTDVVSYAGKQYGADKEMYFNRADIFVHPSFNDCFPLVLLEAMQHGLPIVSTLEGAIPEIVIDKVTGYLVRQEDAGALSEKLEKLIQNPELRQKMGKAGRLNYETKYSLEKFEKRMLEIV